MPTLTLAVLAVALVLVLAVAGTAAAVRARTRRAGPGATREQLEQRMISDEFIAGMREFGADEETLAAAERRNTTIQSQIDEADRSSVTGDLDQVAADLDRVLADFDRVAHDMQWPQRNRRRSDGNR